MIEGRWGWKMLVKIYVLSGIFTSAGILLVQWISSLINPAFAAIQFYSSWGAYIGMIVFIALLMPQQQVTMFLYFIPIRIKMINLIWLVIGLSGMMGIINIIGIVGGFNAGISFPQNLGNIAGALGGLIINRLLRRDF
jgi:membrane associated rhomboid family serine protease